MSTVKPSTTANVCLGLLATIACGWVMVIGRGIIVPILFGALLAFLMYQLSVVIGLIPIVGKRLPKFARMLLATIVAITAILVLSLIFTRNLEQIARVAPGYFEAFSELINRIAALFHFELSLTWQNIQSTLFADIKLDAAIRFGLGSISVSIAHAFLIFIYAAFFLAERRYLDAKIAYAFKDKQARETIQTVLRRIADNVGTYIAIKTLVNVILGVVCWLVLTFFGIEYAIFWALITAIFNYIPYVGSLFAVMLPVFVSIGQYETIETTLILLASLILLQNFIGYYLEPRMLGKGLNMSPLLIIISLAVWTGIWGVAGAILSLPLTAAMIIVLESMPSLRPLAIFMNAGPIPEDEIEQGTQQG